MLTDTIRGMEAQHKGWRFTECNGVRAAPPTLLLAAGHLYYMYGIPGSVSVECAGVADARAELTK